LVENQSQFTYDTIDQVPTNRVGLLLGTAKHLSNGNENRYYRYRISATVNLFNSNKIKYVLISGDNSRSDYDEPSDMKDDLISCGIPESRIYLDYAGFRTLDSVVRSKEVFGQDRLTIISQRFHNERAIYLAKNFGIEAVGFNSKDVSARYGFKVMIREKLARVKMIIDVLVGVSPKFLGDKIEIK